MTFRTILTLGAVLAPAVAIAGGHISEPKVEYGARPFFLIEQMDDSP